jgi:hypothetical protein
MMRAMHHATIIDGLGGINPVSRAVRRHPSNVSRWRKQGIPPGLWPAFVSLGATYDALSAGTQDRSPPPILRRGRKRAGAA